MTKPQTHPAGTVPPAAGLNWRPAMAVFGLLLLLLCWQAGAWLLAQTVPLARLLLPVSVLETLWRMLWHGTDIYVHIGSSLKRVLVGLALALVLGVPLGLLLGLSPRFEACSGGSVQLLRMISPLSWMPVAVMLFGVGDAPVYFLLAFAAVWPVMLNTAAGVRAVDPAWLNLGASLGAMRGETLRYIVLPAVLGPIFTGLRLAIGVVWIVLVPGEMLGVNEGLGYWILDTRDRLAYGELGATIVLIGLLGWFLDALARGLQRRWGCA